MIENCVAFYERVKSKMVIAIKRGTRYITSSSHHYHFTKFYVRTKQNKHECNECQRRPPHTWDLHPRSEEVWVKDEKGAHHHRKKNPNRRVVPLNLPKTLSQKPSHKLVWLGIRHIPIIRYNKYQPYILNKNSRKFLKLPLDHGVGLISQQTPPPDQTNKHLIYSFSPMCSHASLHLDTMVWLERIRNGTERGKRDTNKTSVVTVLNCVLKGS